MEPLNSVDVTMQSPIAFRVISLLVRMYKSRESPLPGTQSGAQIFERDWKEGGSIYAFHGLKERFKEMYPDNPQILRRTLATLAGSVLWGLGVTAVLPLLAYSWDNRVSEGYTGTDPNEWPNQQREQIIWTSKEAKAAIVAAERRGDRGCSADNYASRVSTEGLFGQRTANNMGRKYYDK